MDSHGRNIEYLRISVTQNCNLKCVYCSPGSGGVEDANCTVLTAKDYKTIVGIMAGLGIRKVRITGGEPLMRKDVCGIIAAISGIPGICDISLTTNGVYLDAMAQKLKEAGLMRLNISLDSLKEDRFEQITGANKLKSVLKGIDRAVSIGLLPVKINTVLIKGLNDSEIDDFIRLAKDAPVDVRFIELMPVGKFGEQNQDRAVNNSDIIASHPQLIPCEDEDVNQPARYFKIEGYRGRIGFISPMSHKFCNFCNRIRLTCDGKIKPCLGNNGETDIAGFLGDARRLEAAIRKSIFEKPAGYSFGAGFVSKRNMGAIGG
ncbi:MAG: GTP 3',8-cyclase MoaA [Clostridiales bacterium]|nr:GTP 3',8-cyclase MoaA [Eubacteriales bacterium]MDH7566471.1 GTP 3',8-cyclase MoaA [Clostridiales bacterium]